MKISVRLFIRPGRDGQPLPVLDLKVGEDSYRVFDGEPIKNWSEGCMTGHATEVEIPSASGEAEQRVPDGMVLVPRKQIMGDLNDLQIGDYVEVRYKDGSGKVKGKITKLWVSPHAQAQVNDGWCFHLGDEILVHEPSTDTEERG